jgi:3-hydroxyisobutyrate dehydrogenase
MKLGYVGNGSFAAAAVRRLLGRHQVTVVGTGRDPALEGAGAAVASDLPELARSSDVIIISLGSHSDVREIIFAADGLAQGLSAGKIIIDQSLGLPDDASALSEELRNHGAILLDAPVYTESLDAAPDTTAIMCGGPVDAFESIRPVLSSLCPNVVYCGDSGSGRAAKLVVAAVAACNRLITYECATVGVKNGLALEHMAAVLNKSSGANSASARVLPALGDHGRTADVPLGTAVEELKLASRLAMQCGAPLLFANLARSMFQAAASEFGATATIDEIARVFEASADLDFTDPKTCGAAVA